MSQLPIDEGIARFKENEERVDKFVNQTGSYQTNTAPPLDVETLPSFLTRKDQEITTRYSAFNNRGNWVTATNYAPLDLYVYAGIVYIVLIAHASTTVAADVAAAKATIYQGVSPATLEATLNNERSRFGRVSHASLPRLAKKLKDYLKTPGGVFTVTGFGSSVGVGATLPDPATQAPSAFFKTTLQQALDPAGVRTWAVQNRSANGTVVVEFPTAWTAMLAAGIVPSAPGITTYGMNDGAPLAFNTGQTFDSVYTWHAWAIRTMRAAGIDPVLCTTPHAHTGRTVITLGGMDQLYPTFVAAPNPEQINPPASASFATGNFAGNGINVTANLRYLLVNLAIRQAALDYGCAMIDVEHYWFLAVQKYGEDALFNVGENVHLNLLGHQQSYQKAISDFCYAIANQTQMEGSPTDFFGRKAINPQGGAYPSATLELFSQYDNDEIPLKVFARTGAVDGNGVKAPVEAWRVDATTGDLKSPAVRFAGKLGEKEMTFTDGTTSGFIDYTAAYNNAGALVLSYAVPDDSGGEVRFRGSQPGVALSQIYRALWTSHNGTITLGTPDAIGANTEFSVATSGLNINVTILIAATSLWTKCEQW